MTPAEWTALAERCEKATGPSLQLDHDICITMGRVPIAQPVAGPLYGETLNLRIPALTASLDAIVALVERELPNAVWSVKKHEFSGFDAEAGIHDSGTLRFNAAGHNNDHDPALALCAAFCRAMAAKETDR